MADSIFEGDLLYLALQKVGIDQRKKAFVDASSMGGQAPPPGGDPSGGGGGAPPPAGGPAGAPAPDPTAQALDPAAAGGNPLEARIAALEAGGGAAAGGAKPAGSSKGGKEDINVCIKQILNMLSILFDTMGIPVPTQAMVPDSAAATSQPAPAPAGGDPAAAGGGGPSSVLGGGGPGGPPAPPEPVAPMSSVLGAGGGGGGAAPKQAGYAGLAVNPSTLRSITSDQPNGHATKPSALRILGLGK
jgi:hypothetical protein